MAELKIYLSQGLNERFRKTAMSVYGYGRGSLSKAAEEALAKWCIDHVEPLEQPVSSEQPKELVDKGQSGINPEERQSEVEKPAPAHRPLGNGSAVAPNS